MAVNPFDVTKAVDFTDEQIDLTWVDLPGISIDFSSPQPPMPRFLVGGKGGGRTHLLRRHSFALQHLRHGPNIAEGVREDGYLGIYFRCGGLNASRFSGKGVDEEAWSAAFAFYTELSLAQLVVETLISTLGLGLPEEPSRREEEFVRSVLALFDSVEETSGGGSCHALLGLLREKQRSLDIAINNSSLTRDLTIRIDSTPGRLVFGIPIVARVVFSELSEITFAYLIDEYENLRESQQRYINTLLREKEIPSTFVIGSRLHGLKTHRTLAADEENRVGSEFDLVVLESEYSESSAGYKEFCANMVEQRLAKLVPGWPEGRRASDLFAGSPSPSASSIEEHSLQLAGPVPDAPDVEWPWRARLDQQLKRYEPALSRAAILSSLAIPDSPLHEKFAIFLFYRHWASGDGALLAAAERCGDHATAVAHGSGDPEITETYKHYRHDLYAQLRRDLNKRQEYLGFDSFVRMSGYLPRNLLVVLKQVSRWSVFRGEDPFGAAENISVDSQELGVREASSWFLNDAKGLGDVGEDAQLAIRRLGSLFREARFSDRPVEVSCSTFSTDRRGLTDAARVCLDEAVQHSLLLEISTGRRDKNKHSLDYKYQLNPMLAPMFDLRLARRGSMSLSGAQVNSIFDPKLSDQFGGVRREVLRRLNVPFAAYSDEPTLFDGA